jgi:hypothetical protein
MIINQRKSKINQSKDKKHFLTISQDMIIIAKNKGDPIIQGKLIT